MHLRAKIVYYRLCVNNGEIIVEVIFNFENHDTTVQLFTTFHNFFVVVKLHSVENSTDHILGFS